MMYGEILRPPHGTTPAVNKHANTNICNKKVLEGIKLQLFKEGIYQESIEVNIDSHFRFQAGSN